MALPKLFQRIFWHNYTDPAVNETNLNAMSKGLSDVDDRVIQIASEIMEVSAEAQQYAEESESWAKGTKNGVPVDSSDPAYHNNAKWYSEHPDFDIEELNDVDIINPTAGDAIVWDDNNNKWVNGPADVGLFVKNGILNCRYQTN